MSNSKDKSFPSQEVLSSINPDLLKAQLKTRPLIKIKFGSYFSVCLPFNCKGAEELLACIKKNPLQELKHLDIGGRYTIVLVNTTFEVTQEEFLLESELDHLIEENERLEKISNKISNGLEPVEVQLYKKHPQDIVEEDLKMLPFPQDLDSDSDFDIPF